jgi:lysyl-tRNA synthetase class II
VAGGADARPFSTYHNTLKRHFMLRIATELHLKRLIIGGFERVFELGRIFRNEGMSARHNPEFTTLEVYQAYTDYNGMMELTEGMIRSCTERVHGGLVIQCASCRPVRRACMCDGGSNCTMWRVPALRPSPDLSPCILPAAVGWPHQRHTHDSTAPDSHNGGISRYGEDLTIDLAQPFRRVSMYDLVKEATGTDFWALRHDIAAFRAAGLEVLATAEAASVHAQHLEACSTCGHMVSALFEALVEPTLLQPTFVLDHPVEISPLAKPHRCALAGLPLKRRLTSNGGSCSRSHSACGA